MQDLTAMALFVHVVERGGFTAAANYLHESVSTVSRRIAELEKSLNVRLLERSTRSVRLTELGESFYEHCRRGVEEFEIAQLTIENRQSEMSGSLSITVPPNLAEPYFVPLSVAFQKLYPNARLIISTTERHVDLINEGIDLAFRVGDLTDSRLTVRKIAQYRHRMVASPAYLKAFGAPMHLDDLHDHKVIGFGNSRHVKGWSLQSVSTSEKDIYFRIEPSLTLNDYGGIMWAVKSAYGIAEIPEILCADDLKAGAFVEVLPQWRFVPVTFSVIHLGGKQMPRIARTFLDYCIEELGPKLQPLDV